MRVATFLVLLLATGLPVSLPAWGVERLRMATTTSTENSGLFAVLLPPFERANGCRVDVIAVGTGKALKLGETGDVDLVFVHARKLEDAFVAAGFGVGRKDVMYNDFVLVGPPGDPAVVSGARTVPEAFGRIAAKEALFVSRADGSGTHEKEREIWEAAKRSPGGRWYVETGRGMGEVLMMAAEKGGYALTDRGTFIAFRRKTGLVVLAQGDEKLRNPYGVIVVNPQRHPHVRTGLARRFIDFVTGEEGRALIASYRVDGEPLFYPVAPGRR
ncbi:MAG TPA: substrate-binding domain-containing protein [Candidatus Deferrimicrobiaceae bacterium]